MGSGGHTGGSSREGAGAGDATPWFERPEYRGWLGHGDGDSPRIKQVSGPLARTPGPAVSPFMNELIDIGSVEDLSTMMTERLGRPITLSGGSLYLSKFVALELEAWRAVHPDLPGLTRVEYSDSLGEALGYTYGDGRIQLNRAHFSNTPESLLGHVRDAGLNHIVDDAPEFGAALVVRHELTHAWGFSRKDGHAFLPDVLQVDRDLTEKQTKSALARVEWVRQWGGFTNSVAASLVRNLKYQPEHPAFKKHPPLYALNEKTVGLHISSYGLTSKVEAFADAGVKVAFAGAAAGEASRTLLGLGGSIEGDVAAAEGHVADLVELRRRLDPRSGLAADPAARDRELSPDFATSLLLQATRSLASSRAAATQKLPEEMVRPPDSWGERLAAFQKALDVLTSPPSPGTGTSPQGLTWETTVRPRPAVSPTDGPQPATATGLPAIVPRTARPGVEGAMVWTDIPRRPPERASNRAAGPTVSASRGRPHAPGQGLPPAAAVARGHRSQPAVPDVPSYAAQAGGLNPEAVTGASASSPSPRSASEARSARANSQPGPAGQGVQRRVDDNQRYA